MSRYFNSFLSLWALLFAATSLAQDSATTTDGPLDPTWGVVEGVNDVVQRGIYGARENEAVILDQLQGIRLVNLDNVSLDTAIPETLRVSPDLIAGRFDFRFAQIPEKTRLAIMLSGFLDEPVSLESVRRLETFVRVHLIREGFPYYIVATPEQDITEGVITVIVEPSRLETPVRVTGVEGGTASHIRSVVGLDEDAPISQRDLDTATAFLSRNPYRDVVAIAESGEEAGYTRITLSVDQQFPWTFTVGMNNTGNDATGRERIDAGFQYGNFLGRGDLLSYRLSADPSFDYVLTHSLGTTHFLTPEIDLAFTYSHTKSDNSLPSPFFQDGEYVTASGVVSYRLSNGSGIRAGLDYKTSNSNLLFLDEAVGGNDTHIYQVNLGYTMNKQSERSFWSLDGLLVTSPGGLDNQNSDIAFNGLRAGASAKYAYLRASGNYSRALRPGMVMNVALTAQLSTENLLFTEQLAGGGLSSVRGFEPNAMFGDQGWVLRTSLSYALPQLGITPHLFVDYASLGSVNRLAQEPRVQSIGAAGLAVVMNLFSERISLNAAVGYRFEGKDLNRDTQSLGVNFSLTGRF